MSENQRIIAGRYQLGSLIGRGGMADVYEGTDTRLGRLVAIKLLKSDLANDPAFEARFRQEAQSSARMAHPTIVRIYDAGEEETVDLNGNVLRRPYIVMEYVKGQVLRDLLHQRRLTIEEALEYTEGVLTALSVSHSAGIIHRDIKSANIMITDSGHVKVMDFGIARAVSDSANTQAYSVGIVGTAQYFSPEQARGEHVDARTDLYSTGVLLYEMLAGQPPFKGETAVSVAYQHVSEAVTPPSVHNPKVTPELDAVVLHAMAKDRNERFQSADEFREHLGAAAFSIRAEAAASQTGSLPLVTPTAEQPVAEEQPVAAPVSGEPTEVISDFDRLLRGEDPFAEPEAAPATTVNPAPNFDTSTEIHVGEPVEYVYTDQNPIPVPPKISKDLERADTSLITNPFEALGLDVPTAATYSVDTVEETGAVRVRKPRTSGAPSPRILWGVGSGLSVVIVGLVIWFFALGNLPNITINPSASSGIRVPNVVSQTYDAGKTALENAQLTPNRVYQQSDTVPADTIISTDPAAGTVVATNQVITVYVSSGKGQVTVPNLVGLTEDAAANALTSANLLLGSINSVNSATIPQNQVVSSTPAAGSSVTAGTSINLNVSNGQVLVPNVVNLDVTTAQQRLSAPDVQLTVSVESPTGCTNGAGSTVLSQSLTGSAPQMSTIILTVGCN
ncbi:MAG: protein kinase domain-containing protein [Micrococcales bacterium]